MDGLKRKYIISRVDGTPINPDNFYFVLKIDGEGDINHMTASWMALLAYAKAIQPYLPELADDIYRFYHNFVEKSNKKV